MSDNQQPKPYDAVLGGKNPPPKHAAVLGGIEGVKQRLNNENPQVRITALHQALNYGAEGLNLVIKVLEDESPQVQIQAYSLLVPLSEQKVKRALLKFNPDNLKLEAIEVVTVNRCGEIIQRVSRLARYFVEDLVNGINLEMAYIPGGSFIMGSPETEKLSKDNEGPQHQVTVQPFYMGKFTVTQAQWKAIAILPKIKRDLYPELSNYEGKHKNRPVERVTRSDAAEFCARLSKVTQKKYKLPSEAQWEYACRAETTTPFHYGETITSSLANYRAFQYSYAEEFRGEYHEVLQTTIVGQFPPNNFGLYDMHGNVWEWCQDSPYENYKGAPTDGSSWIRDRNEYETRMLRGGSFNCNPSSCRSASRLPFHTSYIKSYGFRIACEIF